MKKIGLSIIMILFCTLLSSCTYMGIDPQTLMSPPKSSEDQQAIHDLMISENESLDFIYPKRGDYRSAIIMQDFNNDGNDDAMGFYENPEGGIMLKFMTKENGEWSIVSIFANTGIQLDKVVFGDISGDGIDEIIVGWGSPQSLTAVITVYSFVDYKYEESILDYSYNEFILTDFNSDDVKELFTSTVYVNTEDELSEDIEAMARVFSLDENKLSLDYSCELNNTVVRYSTCNFVQVSENEKAVILEGTVDEGVLVTELVYLDGNKIVSPFSSEEMKAQYSYFPRPSNLSISSQDVNDDWTYEIPRAKLQPGLVDGQKLESYNYYIDWVNFNYDDNTTEVVKTSIVISDINLTFDVPADMQMICDYDGKNKYSLHQRVIDDKGELVYERRVMVIQMIDEAEWDDMKEDGRYEELLRDNSGNIYVADSFSDFENEFYDSFRLING